MKKALVLGAGGFIGSHLVKHLKSDGYYVVGADLKFPEFSQTHADRFELHDLRNAKRVNELLGERYYDEVYQLAADMGGAGFVFTKENDADILHNSAQINLNVLDSAAAHKNVGTLFYSSSACVYPQENQTDPNNPNCKEDSAYPANPDSDYGWEKLFGERLYDAYRRNYSLNIRIARYHNIFGIEGTWDGGREKAPAALCRKVAMADCGGGIEIWGTGEQTRSFLYIDECIEGTRRLVGSNHQYPINIGSDEMVTINQLAWMIINISGKNLGIRHIDGPLGVNGRNSDNDLINYSLGWKPSRPLLEGLEKTYEWVEQQVKSRRA